MPSAPRPAPRRTTGSLVIATIVGLGLSILLIWAIVNFASQNPDKVNLGDPVFNVGRADRLSKEIDERGPFLFQDPLSLGRGRNLYIQHLGDDPAAGWSAIEARLPDDEACAVTWDLEKDAFVDCRSGRHSREGKGLVTYPGTVDDGQVRVDLRTGSNEGTTSTSAAG
ncbi:MAG TPA: hypothetical protein VHM89_11240 [Acidimicrobiales bacterium]|nr:hypothetical protein [Acidimicrobiales bacterium]